MRKYKNLLFDLDGTLIDSYEGIAKGLDKVSAAFNTEIPKELYRRFIGPPLSESFAKYMPNVGIDDALKVFREYYLKVGVYEYKLFDGVESMLKNLKKSGYRLFVATSKREKPAEDILAHAGIIDCFEKVFGAGIDSRKEKYEVLEYAFDTYDIDKNESVLIGDTMYDVDGARIAGIDSIAIAYGFGDNGELKASEAVAFLDTPQDVEKYFLQ